MSDLGGLGRRRLGGSSAPSLSIARALVRKSANQTLSTGTPTVLSWNTEIYDTASLHDTVTNNERFTVPGGGYTLAQVYAKALFDTNSTGIRYLLFIQNGGAIDGMAQSVVMAVNFGGTYMSIVSAFVPVLPGDYFTVAARQESGGNLDIAGGASASEFGIILLK